MDDTLVHATKEEETDTLFHRVRCAVNTPQLAVNSATREDKAQGLLATLNTVVNVFRRYCPWTKRERTVWERRHSTSGGTRWDSLVAARIRLTEVSTLDGYLVIQRYLG